jgi:serine/threonine protein kinase
MDSSFRLFDSLPATVLTQMDACRPPPCLANYVVKSTVGKGSFATVWLAWHRFAKVDVAIKVVDHAELAGDDLRTRFIREINLMKQMDHPFIAKLFEIITAEKYTYLVMEYASKGSILDFINKSGRLFEGPARRYFGQVISALEYLHEVRRVAHRDLKAENVLLDRHNNLRLIDFGLSNSITQETGSFKSQCGSPAYCAPEMIMGRSYTKSADIWSAGVLLYALVVGELPFQDSQIQRLLHKIAYSEPEYPEYLSPQLVDLLQKLLTKQPNSRLTLQGIKSHPWFSNSEYSRILNMPFSGEQWLVHGIDRALVDRIADMGIEVKPLIPALLCKEYNELTAIYLILRREEMTDQMCDKLQANVPSLPVQLSMDHMTPMAPRGLARPTGRVIHERRLSCARPDAGTPPKVAVAARVMKRPDGFKSAALASRDEDGRPPEPSTMCPISIISPILFAVNRPA